MSKKINFNIKKNGQAENRQAENGQPDQLARFKVFHLEL